MLRKLIAVVLLGSMLVTTGCMTHRHVIGDGAKSGSVDQERQWYILWGLVPLNTVDSKAMSKGAQNYEIKTEQSALDVIISLFTGIVTVGCRTVEVKK